MLLSTLRRSLPAVLCCLFALGASCAKADDASPPRSPETETAPSPSAAPLPEMLLAGPVDAFAFEDAMAGNPRHRLAMAIRPLGLELTAAPTDTSLLLHTRAWGRSGDLSPLVPATVETEGSTARLHRPQFTEWYENGPEGVRQNFSIARPPDAAATPAELVVEMALGGDANPVQLDERTIALLTPEGEAALRYADPLAWDADRVALPARLELTREQKSWRLRILVEDDNARYPITIDPLITEDTKLLAADGSANAHLGRSVSTTMEAVVAGAPGADGTGAAYVFERDAGGTNVWGEAARLNAPDAASGDLLGAAVGIDDGMIAVGAPGDDDLGAQSGSVHLFSNASGSWTHVVKLTASDGAAGDLFGQAVGVGGDYVVVGAPDHAGGGKAYVFARNQGGADAWGQLAIILPSARAAGDRFGSAVDASGDRAIVGAPEATVSSHSGAGRAFVFAASAGNGWGEIAGLTSATPAATARFGAAVGIDATTAIVGAPGTAAGGAAHVFDRDQGGANLWGEVARLTGGDLASGDRFGSSVDVNKDKAIVGAPSADPGGLFDAGAAYSFARNSGGADAWGEVDKHIASDAATQDQFGQASSITDDVVAIGVWGDDASGSASGAVYHFKINVAPDVVADSYTTPQGQTLNVSAPGLLGNDSDANGDPMTALVQTMPLHGTLSLNADGSFSYQPDSMFTGTDSFTYVASDGQVNSAAATVTINVSDANTAPIAMDDDVTTPEDTPIHIDVLANDSDPDQDTLVISSVAAPANGTAAIDAGMITYTPDRDYHGSDTFNYIVSDGTLTDSATVTITVTAVNDPPSAVDDSLALAEDSSATIDVLANDTDADGDPLSIVSVSGATHGAAVIEAGKVRYTPDPDFNGFDSFDYTVQDPSGANAIGSVSVAVSAVADPPVAVDDAATTDESSTVIIDVLANDSDADGEMLFVSSLTSPAHGVANTTAGQRIEYTPDAGFDGIDTFQYTITDGTSRFDDATVTVTVNAVNFAPRFVAPTPAGTVRAQVMETVEFAVAAVDDDGDTPTLGVQNLPAGSMFDSSTGEFSWMTELEDGGTHVVTFTASDGMNTTAHDVAIRLSFPDADADGVPDGVEVRYGLDTTSPDSDGDNIADIDELGDFRAPFDTDGDGTIDALDLDSDGDGRPDATEAGDVDLATPPIDSDGDGIYDFRDTDSDDDGVEDGDDNCPRVANLDQADTDDDGVGDVCDRDMDGDGLENAVEIELGLDPSDPDTDGDHISDGDEVGSPDAPRDSDGDGVIDALDDDSDDDGIPDAEEAGDDDLTTPPVDSDLDGLPDYRDDDSDDDGVSDATDNCRTTPNTDQADEDEDGVGDACTEADQDLDDDGVVNEEDNCPQTSNPDQSDNDGDGVGDACDDDDDNDGIPNEQDNCPLTPNPDQENSGDDAEGDACDLDADDDGVLDEDDNCPDRANPSQKDADDDGIGDACDSSLLGSDPPDEGCCRTTGGRRDDSSPTLLWLVIGLVLWTRQRLPAPW